MVVLGTVLFAAARLLGALQTALRLQRPRRLTGAETAVVHACSDVARSYRVRVVPGRAGLLSFSARPVTIGTTVYLKSVDTTARPDVLVHECTHVWQYRQVGPSYVGQALAAQWFLRDGYDWRAELGRGHTAWTTFNREAQAQSCRTSTAQATARSSRPTPPAADATFVVDGTGFTALARGAVAALRAGR